MDSEYNSVLNLLGGKPDGIFANSTTEVSLRRCGIGKVNAAVGTMRLIADVHPDCIISTGLAGGIGEGVKVWDVVVAAQTAYHDVFCGMGCEEGQVQGLPTRFEGDKNLVDHAMACRHGIDGDVTFWKGLTCTGDQFITAKEPVREILRKFPDALACDMESAAIAHVCHLSNVPFLSIRTVSDTPLTTNDHALQWEESLKVMSARSFDIVSNFLLSLPEKF